jgi:glycosyltransferase 2 family protein
LNKFLKIAFSFSILYLLLPKININKFLDNFANFSIEAILGCLFLLLLSWVVSVYKWQLLLPKIGFGQLMLASFIGQFYTTVLPGQIAGEIAKAYRLGKGKEDAEKVAASVLVDKLTGLLGVFVVAAGGIITSRLQVSPEIALSIGIVMLIFIIGLFCIKLPFVYYVSTTLLHHFACRWPRFKSFVQQILRLLNAWDEYLSYPFRLTCVLFVGIAFQLIGVWITILIAQAFEINVAFADFCWITGLVSLAVLLPISFGGIGVREGTFVGILSLHGVPVEKSIALSLAIFAFSLIGAIIGCVLECMQIINTERDGAARGNRK